MALSYDWRARHQAVVVGEALFLLGGFERPKSTLCDHDNEDKRRLSSTIKVLDFLCTKRFKTSFAKGVPPFAMMYFSCCVIGREIYYFGGSCKLDSCFHGNLLKLNIDGTDALTWKPVVPGSSVNTPMKKHGCGMISFKTADGRCQLLTFGGAGEHSTTTTQYCQSSQHGRIKYISSPQKPQHCYTNEVFSITVSLPPGIGNCEWIRPEIVGNDFSPRAFFSADTLLNNQGIIFGGQVINDDGHFQRSDDVFLLSCKTDLIEFKKIDNPLSTPWPSRRYHHASAIITSLSSLTDQETQYLVILGGYNDKVIADCWIMDIRDATWSKVDSLPDNITCRQKHSIASFSFSPNLVWLIVSGGYRNGTDPVNKEDNLVLIKLVFNQNTAQWLTGKIINYADIDGNRYYQLFFECINEDRRLNQAKRRRQMSLSDASPTIKELDVSILVTRLQDAERRLQDTERRLQSAQQQNYKLEEQLQQLREESEMKINVMSKESDDNRKIMKKEIKQLKSTITQLRSTSEKMKQDHAMNLDIVKKAENETKELEKYSLKKKLQQQIASLQEDNANTQRKTLEKHAQKLKEKDAIISQRNRMVMSIGSDVNNTKELVKRLEEENLTLNVSLKKHKSESVTNLLELERRGKEIIRQKEAMETMEQLIKKEKETSEKIIAENSHSEIKEKLQTIEMKSAMKNAELEKADEELKELRHQLEKMREELHIRTEHDTQSKQKNPQWMVDEEEVEMTDQVLGKGTYGEVKLAIFRGTRVAAKRLHDYIKEQNDDYNSKLFIREMDLSSKMHHPNIVQFIAASDGVVPILLYELMKTTLLKRVEKCRLKNDEILDITKDILSALAYLHSWKPNPIIHRDISSTNVLSEPCGADRWRSKLSDFGSANLQCNTKTKCPGNPYYTAPEAQNPYSHTPFMDMYSLGILIMEMVNNMKSEWDAAKRQLQIREMEWNFMKSIAERCTLDDHKDRPSARQLLKELAPLLTHEDHWDSK